MPPSPNDTVVTNTSGTITDAEGNVWSLVQTPNDGLRIAINGQVDTSTYFVTKLEYLNNFSNGEVYQDNIANDWWYKSSVSSAWTPTSPLPSTVPASPNGTTLTGTSGQITDAAGNTWSLVSTPNEGQQVALNGIVDPSYNFTAFVTKLEYVNGDIYQQNVAGNWWYKTTPSSPWTPISSPPPPSPSTNELTWLSQSGGDWLSAANWSPAAVPSIIPALYYAPAQPNDNVLIDTGGHRFTITADGQTVGAQQLTISQDNVTFADLNISQNTNIVLENHASLTLAPSASISEAGHALAEYGSITINAGTSMVTAAGAGDYNQFLVATLTQNGTLTLNGEGGFAGHIVNNGRIIGYGSLGALSTDTNNGLIEAQGGTLTVYESYNAPVTGTGHLQIDRNSTLALNSPTAQQINFAGPNATLAVTPNEATGLIVNLTASDVLDVGSSLTLITTTQNADNTTTLKAYDGQTLEETFTLQGQWQAADFAVQSDGRGGTDLIAQSTSAASLASWQHLHGPNLSQLSFSLPHPA